MRKAILWSAAAAMAVLSAACGSQRERIIDNPAIECSNNYFLQIPQVEMTDSSTVLRCVVEYTPGYWIRIDSVSRIVANGVEYPLISAIGIEPGVQTTMPDSAKMAFDLVFGPIPAATKSIDFMEGDGWKLWGIDVTGKADYRSKPEGLPKDIAKVPADGEMPQPIMAVDSTTVNVHLLGYRPSMGDKLEYMVNSYAGPTSDGFEARLASDGTAVLHLNLCGTSMLRIRSAGDVSLPRALVWLAPGETVDVYVDCRRNGDWFLRARKEDDGHLPSVWDNGSYADLNKAIHSMDGQSFGMDMLSGSFGDYHFDGGEYVDYIIGCYRAELDTIEAAGLPMMAREAAEMSLRADLLTAATNSTFLLGYTYSARNGRRPPEFDSINVVITPELMAKIEAVADFNDPRLLMASGTGSMRMATRSSDAGMISAPLVRDMRVYAGMMEKASDMKVTDADMDTLRGLSDPFYAKAIETRVNDMNRVMNASAAMILAAPEVADDKVFDAIVAPHRGKVVMVDLWNTWCGPCQRALKANEPEKSGDLSSDDIVWIYLADESSPMATYASQIPSIMGLHYRLNADQIGAIRERFDVDGIPYYILVDRSGNAIGRPDLRDHNLFKKTLLDAVAE